MTKTTKCVLIATTALLAVAALPFLVVLPFVASNAVAGVYMMVFDRRPTDPELIGKYVYRGDWGIAVLELRADKTFVEGITPTGQQPTQISGSWNSESGDAGVSADITLKPFIAVNDSSKGQRFDVAGLNFYKQRLGSVYRDRS